MLLTPGLFLLQLGDGGGPQEPPLALQLFAALQKSAVVPPSPRRHVSG
jgi:hypothetical protein